jgi:hypothetical protein
MWSTTRKFVIFNYISLIIHHCDLCHWPKCEHDLMIELNCEIILKIKLILVMKMTQNSLSIMCLRSKNDENNSKKSHSSMAFQ